MSIDEPILAVDKIQGNILRGFRTKYLHLAGYKIVDPVASSPWIAALANRLTTLAQVHKFRLSRSRGEISVADTVLLNAALSYKGIQVLGVDVTGVTDGFFSKPMGKQAASLGDRVADYVIGQTWDDTPDILFIIGSDDQKALNKAHVDLRQEASSTGLQHIYSEEGAELPGGIEHFGYRDGISQPGVRGLLSAAPDDFLTLRQIEPTDSRALRFAKPGKPLVWTGQFVFGYPTHLPNSPLTPGEISNGGASWMTNGSFLVFRRLRQDVQAFRDFLTEKSQELSATTGRTYTPRQLGASIVGRWEDGTPVTINPETNDSTVADNDFLVNNFAFRGGTNDIKVIDSMGATQLITGSQEDNDGLRCPLFAHIRKVNPRDQPTDQNSNPDGTLTFQMLRRGIPYGSPFVEGDNEKTDRGLLFLAYQTSFNRQFRILNNLWMNNPSAPERVNVGHDMLVGQNRLGSRFCTFRNAEGSETRLETLARWVIPTGGAFLFSPSISFFQSL